MEDSTVGAVDKFRFDSIADRLAGGGEVSSPLIDEEEVDATADAVMVYCSTDSGEALLRRLSDLGGRAGEAPREELFEEAPGNYQVM